MQVSPEDVDRLAKALAVTITDWLRGIQVVDGQRPPVPFTHPVTPPAPQMIGPARGPLTFDAEFLAGVDWNVWESVPIVNDINGRGSSLPGNGERQWYPNHRYAPLIEVQPWRVEERELVIRATRTPDHLRQHVGYGPDDNPSLEAQFGPAWYDYLSGRLATHRSFSQTYGYFEAEMKLPAGRGLWPAFWLLPLSGAWPPEIDVVEVLGHAPKTVFQTLHWADPPGAGPDHHKSNHFQGDDFDSSTGYHRYGVLWTPEKVEFFLDGAHTRTFATPPDMHQPFYMIVNLAVGGSWPESAAGGPPDPAAVPAEMRIRSVRAWSL